MAGNIDVDALPPVTLDEAIFDLPPTEPDSVTVVLEEPSISAHSLASG